MVIFREAHWRSARVCNEGVARELLEETESRFASLELIEVFDRIYLEDKLTGTEVKRRPRFHFVIADYLCERPRRRDLAPGVM